VLKGIRESRSYALKALINEGNESPEDTLLRFKLEAEILKRVNHPQVPNFVESFSLAGVNYLVQEYVEGLPLSSLVYTGQRLSEAEVREFIRQLLCILNALHNPLNREDAVIHRDLRLANLMLSGDKIFLIDFGMARFMDSGQFPFCPDPLQKKFTTALHCSGNAALRRIPGPYTYQLLRQEISPRSDLFGVGVVAVDLFTSWVEDEALFEKNWGEVLPLSEEFKTFIQKLLSQEGFSNSTEALSYLCGLGLRP